MKIEHAKEEINCLNVEAQCIKTYIWDLRQYTIRHLCQTDPPLATELQERHDAQTSIDMLLSQQLRKMELLPDFTGWRTPGMRAGGNSMDPGPETDEDGGIMGEFDNMVHWTVADAAVEDDIGDQLLSLDNLRPDS